MKLVITRNLVELMPPILVAKAQEPGCAAYFFLATTFKTLIRSCTQLLLRIGSRVRTSEPAAATIAMTAIVVGSIIKS